MIKMLHMRQCDSKTKILPRDLKILYLLFPQKTDFYTPLDRIFSRSAKAFTVCANSRGIAKLHYLPLSFSFFILHCIQSCFFSSFLFSWTRLYRRGIKAQYCLEKLSSFHQANSESNATPYNSIRRRRKKCRGERRSRKI